MQTSTDLMPEVAMAAVKNSPRSGMGIRGQDLWYLLRDRSETDRRFVLGDLISDMRPSQTGPRAFGVAVPDAGELWEAFWRFARAERGLSARAYRRWRAQQSDRDEIPGEASLRRHLGDGSWTSVLVNARLELDADPLAQRFVALGGKFSQEEVIGSVRRWLQTVAGLPRINVFLRDAKATMRQPGYDGPRLPRSNVPINRAGGWRHVLEAADPDGQLRRAAMARVDSPQPQADTNAFKHTYPSVRVRTTYTEQEIRACINRAQSESGNQWVRAQAYDNLARGWRIEMLHAGQAPRAPGSARIQRLLGMSWIEALRWAGDLKGPWPSGYGQGRAFTKQEAFDSLNAAMDDRGEDLRIMSYRDWRQAQLRRAADTGAPTVLPSATVIAHLVGGGSFPAAVKRVLRTRRLQKRKRNGGEVGEGADA
jgi:hypothetical protein